MKTQTYTTTKDYLINTQLAEQTRTYKPISHRELIDTTLESIHRAGFSLDGESYSQAKNGMIANGKYTIRNIADSEMQIQVAWQNSLNKSLSLKWALGIHVFICQNGQVSGDMGAFKKKHMGEIQTFTPYTISEYIKTAGEVFIQMQKERESMKQIELTKRVTAELLGRMYLENEFITSTQLNIVKGQLSHPTYNYNSPGSMWELMQFVTYSLRDTHPSDWMSAHIECNKFFVSEAGIIIPQKEEIQIPEVIDSRQLSWLDQIPAEV